MQKVERLSYFSFYPADYLLDTGDLTLAEHGAYCTMMFRYYWNGAFKEEDRYRGCRTPEDRAAVDAVIDRFFHKDGERYVHNRIERELEKISAYVAHQSKAGRSSAIKRWGIKAVEQDETMPHKGNGSHKLLEDTGDVVELIPMVGGEFFEVRQSLVAEMERLYPAVDIPGTLKQIRGWCLGNPTRLKTPRGIRRFILGWCSRDQDRA